MKKGIFVLMSLGGVASAGTPGLCAGTIDGYLPAICEMYTCVTETQSMMANLTLLIGNPTIAGYSTSCPKGSNCLAGVYWSSTEASYDPQHRAWFITFNSAGSSRDNNGPKQERYGARCSRALTTT